MCLFKKIKLELNLILIFTSELQFVFKENLNNNLAYIEDEIVIRLESLKGDLEQIREGYTEQVDTAEHAICEYVLKLKKKLN